MSLDSVSNQSFMHTFKNNVLFIYLYIGKHSLIEAWALGTFMISAALCTILIENNISGDHAVLKGFYRTYNGIDRHIDHLFTVG